MNIQSLVGRTVSAVEAKMPYDWSETVGHVTIRFTDGTAVLLRPTGMEAEGIEFVEVSE